MGFTDIHRDGKDMEGSEAIKKFRKMGFSGKS